MARHNRFGRGQDQRGHEFIVGYQPDWLHQVKVTRDLPNGRQSTKALFRNPTPPEQAPGTRVRTQIGAPELGLDFEVEINDPRRVVRRITIETVVSQGREQGEVVVVSLSRNRILPVTGISAGES